MTLYDKTRLNGKKTRKGVGDPDTNYEKNIGTGSCKNNDTILEKGNDKGVDRNNDTVSGTMQ